MCSKQIRFHASYLIIVLLATQSHVLPAAVQVDLDERDGLVIVFVALLIDDKDVLLVLYRITVQ